MRKKTIQHLEELHKNSLGKGKNQYTVNIVTYSGHGTRYGGDDIAVIPTYE